MSKRRFNQEQIEELLRNKNVAKCSSKAITYSREFKILAVKRYDEGWSSADIFKEAGFDLDIIGKDIAKDRLTQWRKIRRLKGESGLRVDGRGKASGMGAGRPRTRGLTDVEKIKKLEATVAYLRAENDFLINLRSGKAE